MIDSRSRLPARRAPRRRPRAAGLRLPARPPGARGHPHPRPRGPRRRAALPAARGARALGHRDAPDARPGEVEARRARLGSVRPSYASSPPTMAASRSARSGVEFVRMSHSVPDAVGVCLETAAGRVFHTGDWKLDSTPVDGLRTDVGQARGDRQPRRRPAARRLDQRGAPRLHPVGAGRRTGVPPDHPCPPRPHPDLVLRLEHPPHAAGDRRRARGRPLGQRRRPLDAQEPQHRAQPRLRRSTRRPARAARRPRRAAAASGSSSSAPARRASRSRR